MREWTGCGRALGGPAHAAQKTHGDQSRMTCLSEGMCAAFVKLHTAATVLAPRSKRAIIWRQLTNVARAACQALHPAHRRPAGVMLAKTGLMVSSMSRLSCAAALVPQHAGAKEGVWICACMVNPCQSAANSHDVPSDVLHVLHVLHVHAPVRVHAVWRGSTVARCILHTRKPRSQPYASSREGGEAWP